MFVSFGPIWEFCEQQQHVLTLGVHGWDKHICNKFRSSAGRIRVEGHFGISDRNTKQRFDISFLHQPIQVAMNF